MGNVNLDEMNSIIKKLKKGTDIEFVTKVIKIGVYKNLDALNKALTDFKISSLAKSILKSDAFTLAQTEEDILVYVAGVKELTRKDQATTMEVFAAIKQIGDLCPAEMGPVLREQYTDQPEEETLRIAMPSIKGLHNEPCLFSVVRPKNGDLLLSAIYVSPEYIWAGVDCFVFCAYKRASSKME